MATATPWLTVFDLCRYFRRGRYEVKALDGVSLAFEKGEFVAVVGSSGSGKSTLLALCAGLDTPTSGTVAFEGHDIHSLNRRDLSAYRAHRVGMVFQNFNLIAHYTAHQNVETALLFNNTPRAQRRRRAGEILERLGLSDRVTHRPADLSGGEQQRVALARAIVKHPDILFADEPTGNLDHDNADQIARLMSDLNRDGLSVIMVTHNLEMAQRYAGRIIRLHYGRVADARPVREAP
jgi:putative ABC transport system ATP-binding protein